MHIDLNADVGEGLANDAALLDVVTSANVACGVHAGDAKTMAHTIGLCVARGLAIGAHPSYPDREGFGRRVLDLPRQEIEAAVFDQVSALAALARAQGASLLHVKPHGALYNEAARRLATAEAVVQGVVRSGVGSVVALAGAGTMREAARVARLRLAAEAFADRRYAPDGSLTARALPGAVLTDPEEAAAQALSIVRDRRVIASDGTPLAIAAETLCVHGDTPGAVAIAIAVRRALEGAGIRVAALGA